MVKKQELLARMRALEARGHEDCSLVALFGKNWQQCGAERRVLSGLVAERAVEQVTAGFYRRRTDPVAS